MSSKLLAQIGALTSDQRFVFYEWLAYNLTISVRSVWTDSKLSDSDKVERMKWINEIQHRVTSWLRQVRCEPGINWELDPSEWSNEHPEIASDVAWAISTSYESALKKDLGRALR